MPRADERSVLAFKRPAEVETGVGGGAYAITGAPDLNLAAKERKHTGLTVTVPYLIRFCGFSSFWGVFVPLITIFPQASRLRI